MKERVRKIAIFGSFGFNRGDDAIVTALVQGFLRVRPDLRFVVPVQTQGLFSGDPRVETFPLNRRSIVGFFRILRAIHSVDAVVIGAGSMVQDKFGAGYLKSILGYAWEIAFFCKLLGKPTVSGLLGVDALRTVKGKKIARQFFQWVGPISVRDETSACVAREIIANPGQSVSVVCDPAFYLETANPCVTDARYILLSPAFEGQNEPQIAEMFQSIMARFSENDPALRFCLIAMEEREKEDKGKNQKLFDSLPSDLRERTWLCVPRTVEETISVIRSSVGVVAMRLHALILGYGYVPLYCLSRTTKTEAFMETYDVPGVLLAPDVNIAAAATQAIEACRDVKRRDEHTSRLPALRAKLDLYYQSSLHFLDERCARS